MSRKVQSQWNFGELFPPQETRRVLTVSELTGNVRRVLEKEIGEIWVTGEVTNLRVQSSGHIYFTLKDAGSQVSCVLFRNERVSHREYLQDGQKVVLQGNLTVYEPRGQYQLVVRAVEPQGVGALQLAFEKLKARLQAEGLFAPERKRPLPRYPQRIGLVTSPTGAAIRDVLHVVQRRHPGLELVLVPCRVQGEGAAAEIAAGIRFLNEWNESLPADAHLDLILITRGGGSLEDLWAFNEEIVARAIFDSALPVVSAVGHEIDFTISDFVADFRAATPSAAAEIITDGPYASRQFLADAARRLNLLARGQLEGCRESLQHLEDRLLRLHPRRQIEAQLQYLDELQLALFRRARQRCKEVRTDWENLRQRLVRVRPVAEITRRREAVAELQRRLVALARHRSELGRSTVTRMEARLALLSPLNVLSRGYSITRDAETGTVLREAKQARRGQRLTTRLAEGEVGSVVDS